MFDFDAGKILIIGVVALIVIGPKDLPRVLRQVGQAVGRLRRMAGEFQGQVMDAMKEADLADIRGEITKLGSDAQLNVNFDPVHDIRTELTQAVAPVGAVSTTAEVSHTEGFALPHLPVTEGEGAAAETPSMAAVAFAPVSDIVADAELEPASTEVAVANGGSHAAPPRAKRKILISKRRVPPSGSRSVLDRTGVTRTRAARLRGLEVVDR